MSKTGSDNSGCCCGTITRDRMFQEVADSTQAWPVTGFAASRKPPAAAWTSRARPGPAVTVITGCHAGAPGNLKSSPATLRPVDLPWEWRRGSPRGWRRPEGRGAAPHSRGQPHRSMANARARALEGFDRPFLTMI